MIKEKCWPLEKAQVEAQEEIRQDMLLVKYIMVISLVMVLCTPIAYLPYSGIHHDNNTLFLAVHTIQKFNWPDAVNYVIAFINYFRLVPQGYMMLTYLFSLCYFINHYRYQVSMSLATAP
ncbi:hypothetical protein [Rickettsia endosymbiont of Orchestes rusci]|uniref:hypothetical protein n=1 Tax=Rickettsia endosymbiont of Orchestes rusci TaxID=3066250 RepID=UPI00313E901B